MKRGKLMVIRGNRCVVIAAIASLAVVVLFSRSGLCDGNVAATSGSPSGAAQVLEASARNHRKRGALQYVPHAVSFGRVAAGTSSPPIVVTLTNNGVAPIKIHAIKLTNREFASTRNCMGELAGGSSCQVSVVFSPRTAKRAKGTRVNGMLEIDDNRAGSPQRVRLSGLAVAGIPATPSPTPAPTPVPTPTPIQTPTPPDAPALSTGKVFVSNSACDTVTSYSRNASGNAAPIVPQAALCSPHGIAVDSKGSIYVTNPGRDQRSNTVTVYAAGANGNAAPTAAIGGSNTGLFDPLGIAVDAGGNIYVANDGSDQGRSDAVTVYPAGSNGNITPNATITGSNTRLNAPNSIAVDSSGKIYVANGGDDTVTVYAAGSNGNAAPSATIGGFKTGLQDLQGIAVDSTGKIYATNSGNDTVTVYPAGSNGNVAPVATIGGSNTGLLGPVGIGVDGGGNVYVANQFGANHVGGGSVQVYPPGSGGNVTPSASVTSLSLDSPTGLAVDGGGNIYVVNDNNTVTVYAAGSNGKVVPRAAIGAFATGLSGPAGTAVDGAGNIYVTNESSNSVTVYPPGSNGDVAPTFTIGGSNTGLNSPRAVALDSSGKIYVTNAFNGTVTVYPAESTGNVAPSATIGGSATGLDFPAGIALDGSGKIYVANLESSTVTVYPAGSNGNVAPTSTIGGVNTGLEFPLGVALDSGGKIYVANGSDDTVTVYPAGSNGNVAPSATIGGSNTGLVRPTGVAVDSTGKIYLTNEASEFGGNDTVTVYPAGSNGNVTPSATIEGPNTGLNAPAGLALDGGGNVYVANPGSFIRGSDTITVYPAGSNGNVTPSATIGSDLAELLDPRGVAADGSGNIYVANHGNGNNVDTVTVYAPGSNVNTAPIASISEFFGSQATGVAVDTAGNIYVANYGNDTVTVYSPGSSGFAPPLATIDGDNTGLNQPIAIAVDSGGNIYVANEGSDTVTVYAAQSDGDLAPISTLSGSNTGLGFPDGVAVDASGNIYVANKATDTVTVYAPGSNGNVAPSATIGGSNTGLDAPAAIALDPGANIYVANEGGFESDNTSVTVFATGSSGNVAPSVIITGPGTQLAGPQGIAVVP